MSIFDFFKPKTAKQSFQLADLIEILQDGICITNLAGDLIFMNKAGYDILEIPDDFDLAKLNFFTSFIRDEKNIERIKRSLNQQGLLRNIEIQLYSLKDRLRDVILTSNFISDYRQQNIGSLFLFKDITEIKKIQQQLLQSQKLESVGLLASGIAHDFNNILAAIIPNAELIKMSVPRNSENYHRAEIIEKSAARASEIAHKILTFTRDQDQQKRLINLNDVVQESLELVESSIPDFIFIQTQLEPRLYGILADPTQMQQVLLNLIINSRDAMPKGGEIRIQTCNVELKDDYPFGGLEPGHYIKLSVEDTGVGIPVEILPKIFDPFFTTKEVGKGTGLGLSMIYGIVKGHNGEIFVHTEEKKGTRFDIFLPADKTSVPPVEETPGDTAAPKNLEILVVDDEEYVRNILADILKFLGHKVRKADSGKMALEIFHQHKESIDYVILDMRMPKMDGRVTLEGLHKIKPDVKVIITTGFDSQLSESLKGVGVVGFLRKPYSIRNVSKALEHILSHQVEKADS